MTLRVVAFIALVAIGGTQVSAQAASRQSKSACQPASFGTKAQIAHWQHKMHSTIDSDSIDVRNAQLLYVPDTAFAVVTDSTICAKLLASHNVEAGYTTEELRTPAAASVYAIRVGTRYITWNPAFPSGEFVGHVIWDISFHALSHMF